MKMSLSASVQPCASHHDAASKHPFPRPKRARRAAKKGPMRPHAENMSSAQSPPPGRGTAPASVISSASDHGAGHSEIHLQDVEAAGETIHRVDDGALVDEHVVELDRFRR